jgi:hypothetical protein
VSMRSVPGRGTLFRLEIPAFEDGADLHRNPEGSF